MALNIEEQNAYYHQMAKLSLNHDGVDALLGVKVSDWTSTEVDKAKSFLIQAIEGHSVAAMSYQLMVGTFSNSVQEKLNAYDPKYGLGYVI